MISKLTQLLGEMCLILSKNRTAYSYAVVRKSRPLNSQSGGKFSQILLILLISFIGFNNEAYSQCNPDNTSPVAVCNTLFVTVALDTDGNGILIPQDIDAGSTDACGIATYALSQSSFNCDDLGGGTTVLTVTDGAGNSNTCTTNLIIVDELGPTIICPADVSVDCGDPTTTTAIGDATAIDNCTPTASIFIGAPQDVNVSATSGNCLTIERTFTATDGAGNSNTCVQTIEVEDNEDPELDFGMGIDPPEDITITCSDPVPTAPTATMTDDCTPQSTVNAVDQNNRGGNSLACDFYNYTIERTWTATDNCGKTATHTQIISVENDPLFTAAPTTLNLSANSTANCPSSCSAEVNLDLTNDLMYNCGLAGSQLQNTSFAVVDAAGATVYSGPNLIVNSECLGVGVYNANFSATDFCGNTTTHTVVVTIEDNLPPTANCLSNINIAVPSVGVYVIDPENDLNNNSTDNCASQLTYSVDIPNLDCTVDPIGSTVTVMMTVSDGTLSATCMTDITILNSPPAPFCQDITVELDGTGNYTVAAQDIDNMSMDQCDGIASYEISIDSTTFAATLPLDCSDIGTVAAVLEVTDPAGLSSVCYANITVEDNTDAIAACGFTTYQVLLNADGMYNFTLADSTNFNSLFTDNCDLNIGLDVTSFDCSDVDPTGTTLLTVAVVDDSGNAIFDMNGDSIACEVNVTILDNTAPLIDCADVTLSVDGSGDVVLNPEDLLAGSIFFQSGDNGSGTDGWDEICITAANATTFSFDYTFVSNGTMNTWFGYLINGDYTGILIQGNPVTVSLNAGDNFCYRIRTLDNLASSTVEVYNFSAGLLGDFAISNWDSPTSFNSNGSIFFNDACGVDRYEIRCIGDLTWSESLSYDCDDLATMFGGPICGPQNKQFELRAFDINNNVSATCVANVTFIDKQPPVPVCESKTISLSTGAVNVPAALFNDGSYDECGLMSPSRYAIARPADGIYQDELTFDCDSIGVFPISLLVEDCSGNQAFCATTITVQENQPPKIHCSPDVTIDCSESVDPSNVGFPITVMDACSASVDTTYADVFTGSIACTTIMRTWTATDLSGNQSVCVQEITIEDNIAPTFTVPADITLENCEDPSDLLITGFVADAADNCDPRVGGGIHDAGFVMSYVTGNWNASGAVNLFGTDSVQIVGPNIHPCSLMPGPDTMINNYSIAIPFDGNLKFDFCYRSFDVTGGSDDPFGYMLNGEFTQLSGVDTISNGTINITVEAGDMFAFSQQSNTSSCGSATTTIKNFRGPEGCTSSFVRTWGVFDDCGNINMQDQLITLDITNAPTITFADNMQVVSSGAGLCSGAAVVDFSNAVTGNCGGIVITNDALTKYGVGDGLADASGNYPVGVDSITFTVSSSLGCFTPETHGVTITVIDDTSPFLTCTNSQQTVFLNSAGQGALLTTPNLYSAYDDCGIASVDVTPVNFDCTDLGTVPNVTLTVTDGSGNTNSCNLNVSVVASSSNSSTLTCPADVTVDCSAFTGLTGDYGTATAGGICGNAAPVIISNTFISGDFPTCFVFDRVWSDGTNTCTQTITVEDTMDPVLEEAPADTTLTFLDPNLAISLNFTDNCLADGSVTSTDDDSNRDPDPCVCNHYNYDLVRYWLAIDACGNQDSVAQIITIVDDSIPRITFPDPLVISNDAGVCGAQVDLTIADYISDEAPFSCLDITHNSMFNNGNQINDIDGFYPVGSHDIEFTVEDPCGNVATETLHLVIEDNENVALTCFTFIDVNLDNTGNATITEAQILNGNIVDNCGNSNFTFSLSNSSFNCTDIGPLNSTTLTATDQFGNQNTCTVTVNVLSTFINIGFSASTSSTPASNLLAADGTATVVVTGGSGSSSYLWDDANAQTTATATGLLPGLYMVVITDDNTGCVHTEEIVVASLCPTFNIGQIAGGFGDFVSIPFTVDNFNNIVSFQYTINVNTTVAQFTGVASNFNLPGLTVSNFSTPMSGGSVITVSWIDPGGAPGTTLPSGTSLFDLQLFINGAPGNSSLVYINSTPVNYEIGQFLNGNVVSVPGCTNDPGGNVAVNTSLSLAQVCGNITLENGTPVENVEVFETGGTGLSDTTDVNGDYCIEVGPGTPVCLEPYKNYNHFGSSSIDLYLIQQHVLGNTLFTSPYQVIAADANNSGSVSTLDLVDLQFLILGNYTTLPSNDFWRFVDANQTFNNVLSPFPFDEKINLGPVNSSMLDNDFIAVAIGDVNGTANVQMTDGATDVRAEHSFDFLLDDQTVKKGETFEVTFNASEYADIAGYQMTLEFANESIQFDAVEKLHIDNLKENNFALNGASNGIISLNWYGMQTRNFKDGEALFSLKFTALEDIESLQGLLRSTSSVTNAEAYKMTNNQLEYLNVNLSFNENTTVSTDFALFDNKPNPFKHETIIGFMLPEDAETLITVFDVSGKILMQVNKECFQGYNEMTINASELDGSGILYYEVKTNKNTATGRMILLK